MTDSTPPRFETAGGDEKERNHESRNRARCHCMFLCRGAGRRRVRRRIRESRQSQRQSCRLQSGGAASASFPRSGELHVTKECSTMTTARPVTSARSRPRTSMRSRSARGSSMPRPLISGLSRWTATSSSTCPGPATTLAFGHCHLNLVTGIGLCTFSGGTGKFTHFDASVDVSPPTDGVNWHWDGTYSFSPRD